MALSDIWLWFNIRCIVPFAEKVYFWIFWCIYAPGVNPPIMSCSIFLIWTSLIYFDAFIPLGWPPIGIQGVWRVYTMHTHRPPMGVKPGPDHFFGSKFRFFKFVWNLVWDAKNGPKTARKAFFKYFCSCGARLGYPRLPPGYPAEHHNRIKIVWRKKWHRNGFVV